jgi:hypothetical protein
MKNKALVMVAIAVMATALVASATIAPYNHAFAKKRYSGDSNAQSSAAANDCPAWLKADNFISAVQEQANTNCLIDTNMVQDSDGTAIASVPSQTGPSQDQKIKLNIDVDIDGTTPPIPPVDFGCPEDTVWDITIREAGEDFEVGDVICLFQGLGNHPAFVVPVSGEQPFDETVNTNQPNSESCSPPFQRAQVTSGTPPNPLEFGSFLCAGINP